MAKKNFGMRALALIMALLILGGNLRFDTLAARYGDNDDQETGSWSYAYYLGQEYLGNDPGAATKPDPVGYGFQGVITSITFIDDAGKEWTFRWSSEANGEWRITGKNVSKNAASAWPQITDGKVYVGYCGNTAYTFTLANDGSSESWTYARNNHANWFRYIRFIREYTVNVFYQNDTGDVSYQGVRYAQQDPITGSFTFYYPNGSIIDDSEYRDGEYTEPTTLMPEDYLPQAMINMGYEIKHATNARGQDVTDSGVTISLLGDNVLNVYCTLIPPATEDYTVVHQYYLEGSLEGTVNDGVLQVEKDSDFAAIVNGIEKLPSYNGNTYDYIRYQVNPDAKVITLVYNRIQPTYDYTVTYNANFGEAPETKADAENTAGVVDTTWNVTVDANTFTREGYTFLGWNTDPNGNGTAYAAEDVLALTKDANTAVLYAQWELIPTYDYIVTYNANFGETPETKADAENELGIPDVTKTIGIDNNPFVREHYTFVGWATAPNGPVVYQPGMSLNFTLGGEQELFAVWQEHPKYDYKLIYNSNFGFFPEARPDAENVTAVYDITRSMTVDANAFIRENYTFIGWNTDPNGNGIAYAPGDVITLTREENIEMLYAQWQEHPKYDYTVIYNANFDTDPATAADSENVTAVYDLVWDMGVDANPFLRENYIFLGWNTAADGTGTAYAPGNVIALTKDANTAILYAQWEELPKYDYIVTYDANFGETPETADDEENAIQVYDVAKTITVDANSFVRENYDFIGWAIEPQGAVVYLPGDAITFEKGGSEVLYAQWQEHDKYSYTLVYNGNGGILADGQLAYGDAENVADVYDTEKTFTVDGNTFLREHYDFLGWNTDPAGNGTAYTPEEALTLTAENNTATLYAQWQEHPKYDYTVTYNANFGETPAVAADSENVLQVYDIAKIITIDDNAFTREHYTFLGWAEEPAGEVVYAPGQELSFQLGGSQELFAVWQMNEYLFTVEYLVSIDDGEFALYTGTLPEGAVTEGKLPFGELVDEDVVLPPAALDGDGFAYEYVGLEPIIMVEEGNVVRVYYHYETPAPPVIDPPAPPAPPVDDEDDGGEPVPYNDDGLIDIPDEDVPLADVPQTGDPLIIYAALSAVFGGGFLWLKKKEEDEE